MSDNPYVKKAVLGTKDYHETMRGIVRTIVNDSLNTVYPLDKVPDYPNDEFYISSYKHPARGYVVSIRFRRLNVCYQCIIELRRYWREHNPYMVAKLDIAASSSAKKCSFCGDIYALLALFD